MKKKLSNPANGFVLKDKFLEQSGKSAITPPAKKGEKTNRESKIKKGAGKDNATDTKEKDDPKVYDWERFTVICSCELIDKIKAISEKEGFTIREVVEKFFSNGISAYENKHGRIKVVTKKKRNIDDVL